MKTTQKVILLIGSPKRTSSTSESLGVYLLEKLPQERFTSIIIHLWKAIQSDKEVESLQRDIDSADLLIWSLPLYIDSLPYPVVKAMELIMAHRKRKRLAKHQRMIAIVNNGFPEAHHNEFAISMCQLFADAAGFEWCGGLARGGGMSVNGRPLDECSNYMVGNTKKSLALTVATLIEGQPVPQEAIDLMAKPLMPPAIQRFPLITWFGNRRLKRMAKEGVDLRAKPYARA